MWKKTEKEKRRGKKKRKAKLNTEGKNNLQDSFHDSVDRYHSWQIELVNYQPFSPHVQRVMQVAMICLFWMISLSLSSPRGPHHLRQHSPVCLMMLKGNFPFYHLWSVWFLQHLPLLNM